MRNVSDKFSEKIKTHIFLFNNVFTTVVPFMR